MDLKASFAKWRPFCLGLNVLIHGGQLQDKRIHIKSVSCVRVLLCCFVMLKIRVYAALTLFRKVIAELALFQKVLAALELFREVLAAVVLLRKVLAALALFRQVLAALTLFRTVLAESALFRKDDDDDDDNDVMTCRQLDDYLLHWQPPTIYIVNVYN